MSVHRDYLRQLTRVVFLLALTRSVSCIMVPQDFYEVYERENASSSDRGLTVEHFANYQYHRERFSESIPCFDSFLNKSINEPARSILMILRDETDVNEIAQPFVKRLKSSFAFFTHTPDVDFDIPQDSATSAILLMSNGSSLEDKFYILDPCDHSCLYVAIFIDEFEDEERLLEDADVLTASMWMRRLSVVVILARVRDTVVAAGSVAFEPDRFCTPTSPVVLDRCDGDDWNNLKEISAPAVNNCVFHVAYFEQSPYVISTNSSTELSGFEGRLTEEVARDVKIERTRVEWSDNTSFAEQVRMLLYDETKADLVIGRILQQSNDDIEYSTTYDMLKVVWVVPKVPKVSLKGLVQPFQPYVWSAIGGTMILGGLIKVFLIRDVSWLDIFGLIIGVAISNHPTRLSRKIHFISWSIFGMFLAQVYVDSLADQLINVSDFKIETMKDLMESSFKIGGTTALASVFNKFEQSDKMMMEVRERFVIFDHDKYLDQFGDLLEGKNSTFALVAVLNSSRSGAIETEYAYTMTAEAICSFPLALATYKGFPLLRVINERIHDYIDVGFFDFMIRLALENGTRVRMYAIAQTQEYKSKLHLQQFVPAFLLMVMGFSSGLIFLVLEIVFYPSKLLQ